MTDAAFLDEVARAFYLDIKHAQDDEHRLRILAVSQEIAARFANSYPAFDMQRWSLIIENGHP